MEWKCDQHGTAYHYATVAQDTNKEKALGEWWEKIFTLAAPIKDWNVLIADVWIDNSGRIIGHVQRKEDAIGTDKGFRVALHFDDYVQQLEEAYKATEEVYERVLSDLLLESEELLDSSIWDEAVIKKAKALYDKHPFEIFRAVQGACDYNYNKIHFL
ncbi:MAG: hypothetical protein ACFB0B_05320 [Thermonemataceae bacterium]